MATLNEMLPLQAGSAPDVLSSVQRGFNLANQIKTAPLQRQLLEAQIASQQQQLASRVPQTRFIGSPVRVSKDGKDFLSGLVQNPDGSISMKDVAVGGEFLSTLGETAAEQEARKQRELQTAADIRTQQAGRTVTTKSQAEREQDIISIGLDAARGLPTINRSLELLDTVDTGGFDAALLKAKQVFGVEGADEGELSANLGKAVLSQLRSTFGAAFTQAEGDRLASIEAGFGKSAATNKRLLNNLKQIMNLKIRQAKKAADRTEDDIALQELDDLMSFRITSEQVQPQQAAIAPAQSQEVAEGTIIRNPQTGETLTLVNGQWVAQ